MHANETWRPHAFTNQSQDLSCNFSGVSFQSHSPTLHPSPSVVVKSGCVRISGRPPTLSPSPWKLGQLHSSHSSGTCAFSCNRYVCHCVCICAFSCASRWHVCADLGHSGTKPGRWNGKCMNRWTCPNAVWRSDLKCILNLSPWERIILDAP